MASENQEYDQKSLRCLLGKTEDFDSIAQDCVGFANANGGCLRIGIEDDQDLPPAGQKVPDSLIEKLRKRIPQITVNLAIEPRKCAASNGGEYIELRVLPSKQSIASTPDGRYFIRVADETQPLRGDDLGRLFSDRNSFVWELQRRNVSFNGCDTDKLCALVELLRRSDRVSEFVKSKSDVELLEHYFLVDNGNLTNLGILWIGQRKDRASLNYSPTIQCIRFDDRGEKVWKRPWDDFSLNPLELINAVWDEVPDWRMSQELPAGMFRSNIPHYDETVVRELLANAIVHRPYTQRGDIFINIYPDHLEIHNPGLLPVGVTPSNILQTTSQRNPHLANIFRDLHLMEKEGSGYDRIYEVLLSAGRPIPEVTEGHDRVTVTIRRRILKPEIIDFISRTNDAFQPSQRELIVLGLIAQHTALTSIKLQSLLSLRDSQQVAVWLGGLRDWGLVSTRGKGKATEYFVSPDVLRKLNFKGTTTLQGIETHRLQELVLRDLQIYRTASTPEIRQRIGAEVEPRRIQRVLAVLVSKGLVIQSGNTRARRYTFNPKPPD